MSASMPAVVSAVDAYAPREIALRNLVVVTLGNRVGGTVLVAGVYWCAYLRPQRATAGTGEGTPLSAG